MEEIKLALGDKIKFLDNNLKCVESYKGCIGCFFYHRDEECIANLACTSEKRPDKKDVIFKKI